MVSPDTSKHGVIPLLSLLSQLSVFVEKEEETRAPSHTGLVHFRSSNHLGLLCTGASKMGLSHRATTAASSALCLPVAGVVRGPVAPHS